MSTSLRMKEKTSISVLAALLLSASVFGQDVSAKPDTVYQTEWDAVEYHEPKNEILLIRLEQAELLAKQLKNKVSELKNQPPEYIETSPGLLWQKSIKTFRWDEELKFIRNENWYVKSEVTAFSMMPIELYGNSIEVKWDAYFNKYYMPQVEQQMYNRGVYGVLVGAGTLGAFLSGNEYLAGGAVLICTEFTFDLFGIFK